MTVLISPSINKESFLITARHSTTKMIKKLWNIDFTEEILNRNYYYFYGATVAAFIVWIFATPKIAFFFDPIINNAVHIFHIAPKINISNESILIAKILLCLAIFRFIFLIGVGIADIILYKRVTGNKFDWRGMVNISMANVMMWGFGFLFIAFTPFFNEFMTQYINILENVPKIADINGPIAVVIACLIGDFFLLVSSIDA